MTPSTSILVGCRASQQSFGGVYGLSFNGLRNFLNLSRFKGPRRNFPSNQPTSANGKRPAIMASRHPPPLSTSVIVDLPANADKRTRGRDSSFSPITVDSFEFLASKLDQRTKDAMTVSPLLSLDNPVFKSYLFYTCVLILKVLLMPLLTARLRFSKKVFLSPEDYMFGRKPSVLRTDEDIERVRRAHLNDLENIPFFFLAALAYVLTDPNEWLATSLFRAFTFARIGHTLVYAVVVVPQPARAFAWAIGYLITVYMAVISIKTFLF